MPEPISRRRKNSAEFLEGGKMGTGKQGKGQGGLAPWWKQDSSLSVISFRQRGAPLVPFPCFPVPIFPPSKNSPRSKVSGRFSETNRWVPLSLEWQLSSNVTMLESNR